MPVHLGDASPLPTIVPAVGQTGVVVVVVVVAAAACSEGAAAAAAAAAVAAAAAAAAASPSCEPHAAAPEPRILAPIVDVAQASGGHRTTEGPKGRIFANIQVRTEYIYPCSTIPPHQTPTLFVGVPFQVLTLILYS